ncbi:MAG: hypothetical protein HC914_12350 [Chloroflexaceae bacterium]|nr:hypothetical protein [Chloroflexaceae bacterium]
MIQSVHLLLFIMALSSGIVLLLRDWRITVSALLVNYIIVAIFVAQQQLFVPNLLIARSIGTIVIIKLVTGIATTLILALTALTFSKEYGLEDLDEFGLSELRRAARAAQRQKTLHRPLGDYTLPFWALALVLLVSLTLPRIYPIASSTLVDFAWYWLGLTGIFTLVTATDMLKVGLGLLLTVNSMDLLYTAVISTPQGSGVGIVPLGLLSLVTILLALAVAYLSGLLYGRLKTLELSALYQHYR